MNDTPQQEMGMMREMWRKNIDAETCAIWEAVEVASDLLALDREKYKEKAAEVVAPLVAAAAAFCLGAISGSKEINDWLINTFYKAALAAREAAAILDAAKEAKP